MSAEDRAVERMRAVHLAAGAQPRSFTIHSTETLETLPVTSVIFRVKYGLAYQSAWEDYTRTKIIWSLAQYDDKTWRTSVEMVQSYPGEYWLVLLHGQPCLTCGQFGTHRFAAMNGPRGWLCEDCKDQPVYADGVAHGETQRRDS